jgi:hypothetical protein
MGELDRSRFVQRRLCLPKSGEIVPFTITDRSVHDGRYVLAGRHALRGVDRDGLEHAIGIDVEVVDHRVDVKSGRTGTEPAPPAEHRKGIEAGAAERNVSPASGHRSIVRGEPFGSRPHLSRRRGIE